MRLGSEIATHSCASMRQRLASRRVRVEELVIEHFRLLFGKRRALCPERKMHDSQPAPITMFPDSGRL